jgi:hypothetical protein
MCLACELDALWYAEWERLAAEGANAAGAGSAGVPPALEGEPASIDNEANAQAGGEAANAGGTPALPGVPEKPAAPRSRFFCGEAE